MWFLALPLPFTVRPLSANFVQKNQGGYPYSLFADLEPINGFSIHATDRTNVGRKQRENNVNTPRTATQGLANSYPSLKTFTVSPTQKNRCQNSTRKTYPYRFGYISDLREKRLLTEVKDRTNDATNRHLAGWNQHPIQPRKPTRKPGPKKRTTCTGYYLPKAAGTHKRSQRSGWATTTSRTGDGAKTTLPTQHPPTRTLSYRKVKRKRYRKEVE